MPEKKDKKLSAPSYCLFCGTMMVMVNSKATHNCWSKKKDDLH